MFENFVEKYSAKKLNDFLYDDNFISKLKIFIENEYLDLLLIGKHGIGKTALINAIIEEYFKDCNSDYIKNNTYILNNLKDHGITFYRSEIKNFCQIPPSSLFNKKKLLIIDDIDMIDKLGQTTFKTFIEKWKKNFYLIATTSNIDRVDNNLTSRLFQLHISNKTNQHFLSIIDNIIEKENIVMDNKVKKFIIEQSDNSIKFIFNFLQKIKYLDKPITLEIADNNCTIIGNNDIKLYFDYCINNKYADAIDKILSFTYKGYSICDILEELFNYVKISTQFNELKKYELIKLISKFVMITNTIHEENIEFYILTENIIKIF